jgi:hypothetical protein
MTGKSRTSSVVGDGLDASKWMTVSLSRLLLRENGGGFRTGRVREKKREAGSSERRDGRWRWQRRAWRRVH